MEHQQDDPTDKDQTMKRTFERYDPDEEAKKRKEKEKKAKKKRQQEREEATEKAEKQAKDSEQEAETKKPSFLDMLIDGDKPKPDTGKEQKLEPKTPESTEKPPEHPEATASAETQLNPAELSPHEEREAAFAYITERQARLAAEASERSEDDDETAAETEANQTFLQKLADKLRGDEDASTEEILDATADEMLTETIDEAEEDSELAAREEQPESAAELPPTPYDSIEEQEEQEPFSQDDTTSATASPPSPPASGGATPPTSAGGGSSGDSGGGYGASAGTPDFGGSPDRDPHTPAGQFASATAETTTSGFESVRRRGAGGGEFLLGAFVGYLFGRRRGRIKAESEAEPVKRELEQQVKGLQQKIEIREATVRASARQRVETITPQPEAKNINPVADQQETAPAETHDRQSTYEQELTTTETPVETKKQPFAQSAERATVESSASIQPEQVERLPVQPEQRSLSPESVAAMPLQEVLRGADYVAYRGESLRDLYEGGRISERTLRESYREFLRGNRFERQLERALRQHPEVVSPSPEVALRQPSYALPPEQTPHVNTIDSSNTHSVQPSEIQGAPAIADLPPVDIDPAHRDNYVGNLSPSQQVTIGAIIGIVVVVLILLFWPR